MHSIARAAWLGILVSCMGGEALRAQAPAQPAAPAAFEVASVKPSNPNATGPFGSIPMLLPQGAGGLTATQRGGGEQTKSLRFKGADGREYQFRSLDKDPVAALPPELRTTAAAGPTGRRCPTRTAMRC